MCPTVNRAQNQHETNQRPARCAHENGKQYRDEECSDESFNCLFRTKLDELVSAKHHAADVGGDIIDDDDRDWDPEPDHTLRVRAHKNERVSTT